MNQKTYIDDLKDRCKAFGYKRVCKEIGWPHWKLTQKLGGFTAKPMSPEERGLIEQVLEILATKEG